MKVKIGGYLDLDTIDTDGVAFTIYFQGCNIRCKGCHNPTLQPFDGGEEVEIDEIIDKIKRGIKWYDAVAIMGGEPLDQLEGLKELLIKINKLGLDVWLYTGYNESEIPKDIYNLCDVIIAGPYIEELATGSFPASSNQRIIDNRKGW